MQPSYCFRGANRYSLMTIGGIKADLRTVCLLAQTRAPSICVPALGRRSSYRHTTLAVLLDPVARGLGCHPEIDHPVFLPADRSQTNFLDRDGLRSLAGFTKYRQFLAVLTGGA